MSNDDARPVGDDHQGAAATHQLADGLTCPTCHGRQLFVTHTRGAAPGLVVRRRKCSACGCRFRTHETVAVVTAPGKTGE
ncbi:MAG TPA: hypothetical protein VGE74_32860 [Gemmata sp.]